jgi:flagellar basal body rod protein FlgG
MRAYEQWHETIAGNMSASNVTGFKGLKFSMTAEDTGTLSQLDDVGMDSKVRNYPLPKGDAKLDFSPGLIRQTGSPTHLALGEMGFFELQLPDGNYAYTRDGEFHLNQFGELVSKQGYLVMGDRGAITFEEDTGMRFSVGSDGSISEKGNDPTQKVRVVSVADLSKLSDIGAGNYIMEDPNVDVEEVENPNIQQHHIEQSNVSAMEQMTQMIQVMRAHEATHHVIQQHDQRLGKLINELGQPI